MGQNCCCAPPEHGKLAVISNIPAMGLDSPRGESFVSGFAARLTRSSIEEPWGLTADFADDKMIHVCSLDSDEDSPVKVYNASAEAGKHLLDGDYITSVNGISASDVGPVGAQFCQAMTTAITVDLVVQRPMVFESRVERETETLGLDVIYSSGARSLVIVKVNEGAVKRHAPEVSTGDRIVRVDDTEGTPYRMLLALQAKGPMLLKISRPSWCSSEGS